MPVGLNRALQVRTADRLRAELPRETTSGLPIIDALSDADRRELCDRGGGRLAAVALCLDTSDGHASEADRGLMAGEVARFIDAQVRRTDLLGWLKSETLVVLAPGLDAVGVGRLAERLQAVLTDRFVEIAGVSLSLKIKVGSASRSLASASGWTAGMLGAEAQVQATESRAGTAVA